MKSFLAALLSLIIHGLGQLYKGYFFQAVLWFIVVCVAYTFLYQFIFALIPILLHIACVVQAYVMPKE